MLRDLVDETGAKLFLTDRFRDWINYGNRFNIYEAYAAVARRRARQIIHMASGSLNSYLQNVYRATNQFIESAEQLKNANLARSERFKSAELHWSALDRMMTLNYDETRLHMYMSQVRNPVRIINLSLKWQYRIGEYVLDEGKRKTDFEKMFSVRDFDDFHRYAKISVYRDLYPK